MAITTSFFKSAYISLPIHNLIRISPRVNTELNLFFDKEPLTHKNHCPNTSPRPFLPCAETPASTNTAPSPANHAPSPALPTPPATETAPHPKNLTPSPPKTATQTAAAPITSAAAPSSPPSAP